MTTANVSLCFSRRALPERADHQITEGGESNGPAGSFGYSWIS